LVLFVFFCGVCVPCFGFSGEDASLVISAAEGGIVACYEAVSDAQEAGANVSALLSVLDEAGWLLSRAKLAYATGDFGSAVSFANQSRLKLNGFIAEAEVLRETALRQGHLDFMINVVGSAVGAVAVVVGGFAVWIFLKRKYDRVEARS